MRHANAICTTNVNKPLTLFFSIAVAYTLGIYLLNLFLAFLTPKFDPSLKI